MAKFKLTRAFNYLIILLSFFLGDCGFYNLEEVESTEVELVNPKVDPNISVSLASGNYESGLALYFNDLDGGSYIDFETDSSSSCYNADPDYSSRADDCYLINSEGSHTVKFRNRTNFEYSNWLERSYNISYEQKNVAIDNITFEEQLTTCRISSSGSSYKLEGRISLTNTNYSDKIVSLFVYVNDINQVGSALTVTSYYDAGINIESNGNDFLYYPSDFHTGTSGSSCTITLDEMNLGVKAAGTISCNLNSSTSRDIFGTNAVVTTSSWQCDNWGSL